MSFNLKQLSYLALDFLIFMALPLSFNLLYVYTFHGVLEGAILNTYLVLLIWIIVTSLRLFLAVFLSQHIVRWINVSLMASLSLLLFLFYSLSAIGLASWGRAPSITMIYVYFSQLNTLINTLDISLWMLLLFILITLSILIFLYNCVWSKTLWLSLLAHKLRCSASLVIFMSLGAIGVISFWQNFYYSWDVTNEVFLEVFHPEFSAQ
jgi:hypothetical protein